MLARAGSSRFASWRSPRGSPGLARGLRDGAGAPPAPRRETPQEQQDAERQREERRYEPLQPAIIVRAWTARGDGARHELTSGGKVRRGGRLERAGDRLLSWRCLEREIGAER